MEKKLTAVEWLANEIMRIPKNMFNERYGFIELRYIDNDKLYLANGDIIHLIEKAIQMEKEQINNAYDSGCTGEVFELNCNESAEQYYKSRYGKE